MCRHIYDWNIVNCDVKQPVHTHTQILNIQDLTETFVSKVDWNSRYQKLTAKFDSETEDDIGTSRVFTKSRVYY